MVDIGVLLCKVADFHRIQKDRLRLSPAEERTCTDMPDILKRQLQGATGGSTKITPTLSKKSATKDLILSPFFQAFPDYSGMYEGINCSRQCLHESLGSQVVFQVFLLRGPFFLNIKLPSLPLWRGDAGASYPKMGGGSKTNASRGSKPNAEC